MNKPEELVTEIKKSLGDKLESAVLYGSGAAEDQTKHFSNFNLFFVVKDLELETLKAVSLLVNKWNKEGHPAPLFFTQGHMKDAQDVFPIEFIDIKNSHRVLFGPDPFLNLNISSNNIRGQLEYELRAKLIQLRQNFILANGDEKEIKELMARSISSFTALFKGILIMLNQPVPAKKREVWMALKNYVGVDLWALERILEIRDGKKPANTTTEEVFDRLMQSVENAIGFINDYKRENKI